MADSASSTPVRVRFAPSPTGRLHIGGLRTALYNYLFAHKHDGDFILRIEDTDQSRYVEEAEADLMQALSWSGLNYDEGPGTGGPHQPYYQSERSGLYQRYAQQLIDSGHAYYAFDTEDELEAMRERHASDDNPSPAYNAHTRMEMRNSLSLDDDEVQQLLDDGAPHVVRLKMPRTETVRFEDEVRGTVTFETQGLDDQVLLKSDGLPTYHLANVVDDHHMRISHVIRGEEWLPSTPKHVLLYDAFGWTPPAFAHLPLIMSPESGKLSKRDSNELGIPVFVTDYREAGYQPEALINFLALLGWHPSDEQEIFSLQELVEAFSLDRVGVSGVQFDLDKLNWYNEQYVRAMSPEDFAEALRVQLTEVHQPITHERLVAIAELTQDRVSKVGDVLTEHSYLFEDPTEYDEDDVAKSWNDQSAELLRALAEVYEDASTFDRDVVDQGMRDVAEKHDVGLGAVIHPVRLAISGRTQGPGIFDLVAFIGRETTLRRIDAVIDALG